MEITKKPSKDVRLDRHSGSGISGSPKKGGGGGKGTWGKGGIDDLVTVRADSNDPNYNSDEEGEEVIMKPVEVVSPIEAILKEYFSEGDIVETSRRIREVHGGIAHPNFVWKAMALSMERQPYEREQISKLLSGLYSETISSQSIAEGFQTALDRLDDLVLDIPTAVEMLGKFMARGIVDEIIPPAFLKNARVDKNKLSIESLELANGLVTDNHRSKKLEHIWGPGDLESVKRLKEEVSLLVQEFISTRDKSEADRCVRKLNAPSFHFQVVKQALRMALSTNDDDRKKVLDLLSFFHKEGLIVPDHMSHGFKTCQEALTDIKLDIPSAPGIFSDIVKKAQEEGWLSVDYK